MMDYMTAHMMDTMMGATGHKIRVAYNLPMVYNGSFNGSLDSTHNS